MTKDREQKEEEFWAYHRRNPHVYEWFDRLTRYTLSKGCKHTSAYLIFEQIRWETGVEAQGDEWKVNNNHRPYYARLWMDRNPEHEGYMFVRGPRHFQYDFHLI